MDSNLAKRIAFAAVAIPLAVGLVWLGGWPLAVLVSLIAVLGLRELFDIAARQGNEPLRGIGMLLAAVIPLMAYAALTSPEVAGNVTRWLPYLVAGAIIALLVQALAVRAPTERPLGAVAITLFGIGYTSVLPTFLLDIRHATMPMQSWAGVALVFFPLVVTWACDTAAMFGGRAIGGPKLSPTISPGKTRAGGIAGLVGGVAVAPVFALWLFPAAGIAMDLAHALVTAGILATIGQLGDLAESLFKREAGVKDSSALIPGHGGVLNRFDSLYVVLPVAAACYKFFGLT
jgi:phosphatidate cytidylyltransferase